MWIKRTEYEKLRDTLIRSEVRLEVTEKYLLSANALADTYKEQRDALQGRVAELEAAILGLNDEVVKERKVRVERPVPVRLDESLFAEDEDLVRRDREFIKSEGTADPLLADEVGEE